MRLLLDSHAVLGWLGTEGGRGLPSAVGQAIAEAAAITVSVASVWELDIKRVSGRLQMPDTLAETLQESLIEILPISCKHALAAARLPLHHRDPFDRMLVAQAMTEGLTLVTTDREIRRYDVDVFWG